MAYDEGLAIRLQDILRDEAGLAGKKMFGGLAFLLDGNMAAGVYGDDLLVRTDPGQQNTLLAEPGTRPLGAATRQLRTLADRDNAPRMAGALTREHVDLDNQQTRTLRSRPAWPCRARSGSKAIAATLDAGVPAPAPRLALPGD